MALYRKDTISSEHIHSAVSNTRVNLSRKFSGFYYRKRKMVCGVKSALCEYLQVLSTALWKPVPLSPMYVLVFKPQVYFIFHVSLSLEHSHTHGQSIGYFGLHA